MRYREWEPIRIKALKKGQINQRYPQINEASVLYSFLYLLRSRKDFYVRDYKQE